MRLFYRLIPAIILIALMAGVLGCSGNAPATLPGVELENGVDTLREAARANNRYLIGYWTVALDPVAETWEITPNRNVAFHAEIRYFLEQWPCNTCLWFDEVFFYPNDVVKLKVRITHPFDDPWLDGFDVRAVPILQSTMTFGSMSLSYGVLDDPDGWTYLWDNPSITGNLNPYIAYNKTTSRRRFGAGTSSYEWMEFDFSETGWVFDYAVDASWDFPDGTYFPPTANCEEVYKLDVTVDGKLWDNYVNTSIITVDAYDWQGHETIDEITVESPELFDGRLELDKIAWSGNYAVYGLAITNENHAVPGTYPLLIRATDVNHASSNYLRTYKIGWVDVIHQDTPHGIEITNPSSALTKYCNFGQFIYNITAQVTPAIADVTVQWWWTDPDEPQSDPAWGETGPWELDTDANDNHADDDAWIVGSPNVPESVPPADFHYGTTLTNSQGITTITFKVSTYGGDNYEIHARRMDTSEEDTSPIITVKRKATIYKSSMQSSGGQSGYYLPDHSMTQDAYTPGYIDLVFTDLDLDVDYQYQLPTDANWLYAYCDDIYHPTSHQLADVGVDRFTNSNVLGIALYWVGGVPAQHTVLGVGRIREVGEPDHLYENAVLIHEVGHNFGLDHVTQGSGVMEPQCTCKTRFCRFSLNILREDPAWD